jgi:hypothetical protein
MFPSLAKRILDRVFSVLELALVTSATPRHQDVGRPLCDGLEATFPIHRGTPERIARSSNHLRDARRIKIFRPRAKILKNRQKFVILRVAAKYRKGEPKKRCIPASHSRTGTRLSRPEPTNVEDAEMTAVQIVIGLVVLRWIGLIAQACLPFDGEQRPRS